jgi:hypothetical protein
VFWLLYFVHKLNHAFCLLALVSKKLDFTDLDVRTLEMLHVGYENPFESLRFFVLLMELVLRKPVRKFEI